MRWSYAGPIPHMRCTQVYEHAEPAHHGWQNNYVCLPHDSAVQLSWSQAGRLPGKQCVAIAEAADPHTWGDNYLCY